MSRVTFGIVTTFFEDVWSRNFLNMFASPLRIPEYLMGLVLSGIITSVVGLGLMMGLAGIVFPFEFVVVWLVEWRRFLLILFMTGIALGIFRHFALVLSA